MTGKFFVANKFISVQASFLLGKQVFLWGHRKKLVNPPQLKLVCPNKNLPAPIK